MFSGDWLSYGCGGLVCKRMVVYCCVSSGGRLRKLIGWQKGVSYGCGGVVCTRMVLC